MKRVLLLVLAATAFRCDAQISDVAINAFNASYSAEKSQDYQKAIGELQGIYNESFYEANLRMGWLYYQKKDYAQSVKYYRQAVRLRPASIEALYGLVNPTAALQNWPDVFAAYQKILEIDPANSLANYRIALMYYYRKEWSSAAKHLQTVLDHYPFDYDSILLMAQVKLSEGKLSESKGYYQRALLYNPSNEAIKTVLGKL
jgi:tetratricopeptide (TPR) repeat protein